MRVCSLNSQLWVKVGDDEKIGQPTQMKTPLQCGLCLLTTGECYYFRPPTRISILKFAFLRSAIAVGLCFLLFQDKFLVMGPKKDKPSYPSWPPAVAFSCLFLAL